ncbi:MAG: hypothetical protein IIA55_13885 [Gemmatimonadetes bacterium]|nr:hypothetical protein [Gemmatimonadota bacterium]
MADNSQPTRRLRFQAVGLLAVALVVGILVGVAGERLRVTQSEPYRRGFVRDSGLLPPPLEGIGLTEIQRAQIEEILLLRRNRTDSIMRVVLPQIRFHIENVRSEIADILTPEQLDQLDKDFEAMRLRHGDRPGGRRWLHRGGGEGGERGDRRRPPEQ